MMIVSPCRRTLISLRLIWAVLAVSGVALFLTIGLSDPERFRINLFSIAVSMMLTGTAVIGLLFRWGPLIPSILIGALVALLLVMLALMNGLELPGDPVTWLVYSPAAGAVLGAAVGWWLDCRLSRKNHSSGEPPLIPNSLSGPAAAGSRA